MLGRPRVSTLTRMSLESKPVTGRSRSLLGAALIMLAPWSAFAQDVPRLAEEVAYTNPSDGTALMAYLSVPAGSGPHPGVVLLSIAGTDAITARLVGAGYAVLAPVRRGFVAVEPLLRATYADLAGDLGASLDHLGALPQVSADQLAVIAQADDAPPAILAMAATSSPVPLVLMAPPAFSGVAEFRREQRATARRDGAAGEELRALDRYVEQIAEIALNNTEPNVREYQLGALRARSPVQLPRNAAFPMDDRQAHFLASPLWHDRLAFEPQVALGLLRSSTLVVIGSDEASTPIDAYVDSLRRGFAAARTDDTAVCLVSGRIRHSFTPQSMDAILEWLDRRLDRRMDSGDVSWGSIPSGCSGDPARQAPDSTFYGWEPPAHASMVPRNVAPTHLGTRAAG